MAMKKNPARRILRLRRVALAIFFHSAAVRSRGAFLCHRTKFPMTQKSHMTSKKVMWRKVDRNLEKSTYQF